MQIVFQIFCLCKVPGISVKPSLWLVADDYDKDADKWKNRGSGKDLNDVVRRGSVSKVSKSGNGAAAEVTSIEGTLQTGLSFGGGLVSSNNYAMCTLTRYSGNHRNRILLGGGNWLFGHWAQRSGVIHAQTWQTSHNQDSRIPRDEWLILCASGTSVLGNGISTGNGKAVHAPNHGTIGVNHDPGHACCTGEVSDFQIAEIIIWNTALSMDQLKAAHQYLSNVLKNGRVLKKAAWLEHL